MWPWNAKQVPTYTDVSSTGAPGRCDRCNDHAMIWFNGWQLLCWNHYCDEMALRDHGQRETTESKE